MEYRLAPFNLTESSAKTEKSRDSIARTPRIS